MAEVRKKTVEDVYETSKIKVKEKKRDNNKNVEVKKDSNEEKRGIFARLRIFINGVRSEFKKVHWTTKGNMLKYSVASIVFILFCSGFFYLIEVLFALVQSLFN